MVKRITLSVLLAVIVAVGGVLFEQHTLIAHAATAPTISPDGASLTSTTIDIPEATLQGNIKVVSGVAAYASKTATIFDTSKLPAMATSHYLVAAYTITAGTLAVSVHVQVKKGHHIRVREIGADQQKHTVLMAIGKALTPVSIPKNANGPSISAPATADITPPATGKQNTVFKPLTLASTGDFETAWYDPLGIEVVSAGSVMTCNYNYSYVYTCYGYGTGWVNGDGWYYRGPLTSYTNQYSSYAEQDTYMVAENDSFAFSTTIVTYYPNSFVIYSDGSINGWVSTAVTQGAGFLLHYDTDLNAG